MIKQVTSCDYNFAIKLSNLENALFKNSWPPMMIYQKVNDGTFVYWIFLYEEKIISLIKDKSKQTKKTISTKN